MHDGMPDCLRGVYLLRPYQHEKRCTLYGRTFSKLWTKNRRHGFSLSSSTTIIFIIIVVSWIRCAMSSASPSAIIILFCHSCLGGSGSRLLSFHLFTFSFWQHLFVFFFACPISLKRFIGRHRSVAGSHYSLFRAKYEIREHGERHFPSIIPSPRHSNGALLRQSNAWRVRPSLRNIISLVPFPKLRIVNMMAWWPSIKCGSQFMWGGETLLPLCVIFIF